MDKINAYYSKQIALKALDYAVCKDECSKLNIKHDKTEAEQQLLEHWKDLRDKARDAYSEATEGWVLALREVTFDPIQHPDLVEAMRAAKAVTEV